MDFSILDARVEKMTEFFPALTVSVYKDGHEVYFKRHGKKTAEGDEPLSGDEVYYIYSCSKVTTVVAAMQLLERGCILLSDPLYMYLPEYRHMTVRREDGTLCEAKNTITIGNLFDMTAGLSYDLASPSILAMQKKTGGVMPTREVVRAIAAEPLLFEPGTSWQYSLCHDVLAAVCEVVSGKRFAALVRENIFEPLEMRDSAYHLTRETEKRLCGKYQLEPDESGDCMAGRIRGRLKRDDKNQYIFGPGYDSGGAGIVSTPQDYAKLAAALSMGGMGINGERILSASAVELMKRNRLDEAKRKVYMGSASYGYGLGVRTMLNPGADGSLSPEGEFGWNGAAGSFFLADTENRVGAFYMTHVNGGDGGYYQPRFVNALYASLGRN